MDKLILERTPEALHGSIIVAVAFPAHGCSHLELIHQPPVFMGTVLTPTIRMVDQACSGPFGCYGFEQGIITLLDTKNNERRDIPMDGTVRATLETLERKCPFVFCSEDGQSFEDVGRSFETALRKSGIEDFRFHDLRHTFASNLVMEGVDIMTVRELMGHKTLEMTLRYYHLAPNHKARAINILDRVMSQNPPQSSTPQKVVALSY